MRGRRLVTGALVACLAALIMTGGLTAAFTLRGTSDERPPGAQAALAVPDVGSAATGPAASPLLAAVPKLVNFQGRLTNPATGQPVPDGSYSVTFRVFDASSGGTQLWSETQPTVAVANGLFNVLLGSVNPLAASVFDGDPRYLEVQVGTDPAMTPRLRFATVPYAFQADRAAWGGLSGVPASFADNVDNDTLAALSCAGGQVAKWNAAAGQWQCGNDEIGGTSNAWSLTGNSGTNPSTNFLGTTDSQPLIFKSNGLEAMRISASRRLGIGTSSPTYKLDAVGDRIRLRNSEAAGAKEITLRTDGGAVDLMANNANLFAYSNTGNTIIQPSGGNVGIGTESPSYKLDVVGGEIRLRDSGAAGAREIELYMGGAGVGLGAKNANLYIEAATYNTIIQPWGYSGNVGIGTETPADKLTVRGNVLVLGASTGAPVVELGEGLDYAEGFDVSNDLGIGPGTVLIIDPDNPGKLAMSSVPYDSRVAGVVTGANGLGSGVRLAGDQFDFDVALAGRVYVNVDATYGEVSPGDLLTTSPTPGYAMVVKDHSRAQGAILGKAMEELQEGERGQILVLVALQ